MHKRFWREVGLKLCTKRLAGKVGLPIPFFKKNVFERDLDYNKNSVDRFSDTISFMRSMYISHEYQHKLQVQEEEKQTAASNTDYLKATVKVLDLLKRLEECSVKLHLKLHLPWNMNALKGAPLKYFSSCSCNLLKAFIYSWMFKKLAPPRAMK